MWALDSGLRSFAPASHHSITVPGFVNALQILSLPTTSIDPSTWRGGISNGHKDHELDDNDGYSREHGERIDNENPLPNPIRTPREILLVSAIGQEPRLGRWMRIKDNVRNGAFVAHLQLDEAGQATFS